MEFRFSSLKFFHTFHIFKFVSPIIIFCSFLLILLGWVLEGDWREWRRSVSADLAPRTDACHLPLLPRPTFCYSHTQCSASLAQPAVASIFPTVKTSLSPSGTLNEFCGFICKICPQLVVFSFLWFWTLSYWKSVLLQTSRIWTDPLECVRIHIVFQFQSL